MVRVLIVDDEPAGGEALASVLRWEGFTVHVVEDAETALELVRLLTFDLLLVDLRLPGLSGADLLRVLRGASVDVPAILYSALPDDEVATAAAACSFRDSHTGRTIPGPNHWLTKPIDRQTLLQTVEEVIMRRSSLPPSRRS